MELFASLHALALPKSRKKPLYSIRAVEGITQ